MLAAHADPEPHAPPPVARRALIVLVDGLCVAEARAMASFSRRGGLSATIELPLPTLSQPFYHSFLTGVPPSGSGIRRNFAAPRALFDTLADRVRAAGGRAGFVSEDLDWMPALGAAHGELDAHGPDALAAPLDALLDDVARGEGPELAIVHVLAVDETGHDFGLASPEHRAALRSAAEVVVRAESSASSGGALLVLLSDHGHILPGGHGGDEPEVRHAPFVLRGPGLPTRTERAIGVESIAPLVAAWMGVAPPRSAVGVVPARLAPPGHRASPSALGRARILEQATAADAAALARARVLGLALFAFVALGLLGTVKRAFDGFDRGTLVAPILVATLVPLGHVVVLGRPLTMSALDEATTQGIRVAVVGALASVLAIGAGAAAARWQSSAVAPKGPLVASVRRSAAAVGWTALALAGLSMAWPGGALGPWPLSAFELYAPIVAIAGGAGAALGAAAVLLFTLRAPHGDPAPALLQEEPPSARRPPE